MNARKGNWTIPQLLLDLEARVAELEAANKPVYVHHVSFDADNIGGMYLDIISVTGTPFTSDTLLKHLFALPEDTPITCTGFSATDQAIVYLKKIGNQLYVGTNDSASFNFATVRLFTDYVEQIKI